MTGGYDVIIFDSVGMPYDGDTPGRMGLGGSEFETILLAQEIARQGRRVLVLNNVALPSTVANVDYANHTVAEAANLECTVLLVVRYSRVPPVRHQRLVVAVSDAGAADHAHFGPYFARAAKVEATLVTVSSWQRSLFPDSWRSVVIPNILPDEVYAYRAPTRHSARFVYASAALKGLAATIELFGELKRDPLLSDAELVVCNPGYDVADERALARPGVRFLGSLPFDGLVREMGACAGLFYVNVFPETFCIVAAMAEALDLRVHVLCVNGFGALRETVKSPLLTSQRAEFVSTFREAYRSPLDPRWHAKGKDYRADTVMQRWSSVLRLDGSEQRAVPYEPSRPQTVCLNMIVKNEAPVIRRCLDSVKPLVSHWVIVDTGSTDGTQDIIRHHMKDIPGELHERPWRDFAANRSEAIELARGKGDYLLVVDADDVLEAPPGFVLPPLTLDRYDLTVVEGAVSYSRSQLFKSDAGFRYTGVIHEYLDAEGPRTQGRVDGLVYRRLSGGARSRDPEQLAKDVAVLEGALVVEPDNPRYLFFLAQTLRVAGEHEKAVAAYERRAALGGWQEEAWVALFAVAQLRVTMGESEDRILAGFLRAYEYRPRRAEPLCDLALYYRLKGRYALAHVFASAAKGIPRPDDEVLFVDEAVYAWRALDEYAISSYYVGRHEEAISANRQLLASPHLPEAERERVRTNMAFSTDALGRGQAGR